MDNVKTECCGGCDGTGRSQSSTDEWDAGGHYTDDVDGTCDECGGSGEVTVEEGQS